MIPLLPLRRQLVVPADAEVAFGTFTDEIALWWPLADHGVFGAGATVELRDGRLVETASDGQEAEWGTVLDWDPPRRLRLTWHPGQPADAATEVAVHFVPVGEGQTLVTLEHRGWERLADPAAARADYTQGWRGVLARFGTQTALGTPGRKGDGELWFALVHTEGPALAPGQSPFVHPDFGAHLAFLTRLRADGLLVAAGALDGGGHGMTIVRLPDPADAAELVRRAQEEDESVVRGVFQVRVRPWRVALTG